MLTLRSAALAISACGTLLLASCGGAQSRLASHMHRGQEYFDQGNFTKANVEFRNAMQIAPKDPPARLMAGHTAEHLGQFGAAMSLYQSVVDTNPDNGDGAASLARLLTMAGFPQKGLDIVRPALQKHPEDPELLTARAVAELGLKDGTAARTDVERALKIAPANVDAVALRANLYRQGGDSEAAANLLNRAIGQSPNDVGLREMLASLYASGGDPAKAEEQLRALIELKPHELRYRNELAGVYSRDKKIDAAQQVMQQAIAAFPESVPAKLSLVDFLAAARSPADGERALRQFIAREPKNYELQLHLGSMLESAGNSKEAFAVYEEVIRQADTEPAGLTARDRIAVLDMALGRSDDASRRVAEVLLKNPRDTQALALRGRMELQKHDPVAAIADLRAVLRDQPKAVGVQRALAQAHVENGETGLAADVLRSAHENAPTDNSLRIDLAQMLLRTGRGDESVKLLEEGVRATPADAPLREALARAYIATENFKAARTAADDIKTMSPTSATGPFLAGLAAQGDNRLGDAQEEFERALALQPHSLEALSALARLDIARKHPEQAIARMKNAAEHDPSGYSWNLLGELYLSRKQSPSAADAFTHAIALSPQWWLPYRNLALAKLVLNDTSGAIAQYDAAIKAGPSELSPVSELATLLANQGRIDEAIQRYEAAYAATHSRMIANNLAMLLVTYKKDRQSLDRARDLTRGFDSASDGDLLDTTGWVHFKRAEYADALPALERAALRAPQSPVVRYHLGMAELQAGRTDRARADLQSALSSSAKFPGVDEARTALASLGSETG